MLGVWKRTQNCKFTVSVQQSWHSWVMCGNLTWSLIHEHSGNGESVLWFQARLNEGRKRAIADTPSGRHGTQWDVEFCPFRYQIKLFLSFLRRYIQIMKIVYPKLGQSRLIMFSPPPKFWGSHNIFRQEIRKLNIKNHTVCLGEEKKKPLHYSMNFHLSWLKTRLLQWMAHGGNMFLHFVLIKLPKSNMKCTYRRGNCSCVQEHLCHEENINY